MKYRYCIYMNQPAAPSPQPIVVEADKQNATSTTLKLETDNGELVGFFADVLGWYRMPKRG